MSLHKKETEKIEIVARPDLPPWAAVAAVLALAEATPFPTADLTTAACGIALTFILLVAGRGAGSGGGFWVSGIGVMTTFPLTFLIRTWGPDFRSFLMVAVLF